jgi:hypothetical protein
MDGMGVAIAQKELMRDDVNSGPRQHTAACVRRDLCLGSWTAALAVPDMTAF